MKKIATETKVKNRDVWEKYNKLAVFARLFLSDDEKVLLDETSQTLKDAGLKPKQLMDWLLNKFAIKVVGRRK